LENDFGLNFDDHVVKISILFKNKQSYIRTFLHRAQYLSDFDIFWSFSETFLVTLIQGETNSLKARFFVSPPQLGHKGLTAVAQCFRCFLAASHGRLTASYAMTHSYTQTLRQLGAKKKKTGLQQKNRFSGRAKLEQPFS
jgi:hypothetical protein